jgi:hypothetical protein
LRDLRAELVRQTDMLAAIRQALEQQRRPSSLSRRDRELLVAMLPAVAGALGSDPFASRDLAADSSPGLRLVLRDLSVKQIGRLLARAEGIPIEGWLVERCGVEINVALWRVVAVSHRLESGTGIGRSGSIERGEPDA